MTRRIFRSALALAWLYLAPIALTGQDPDPWAALTRPRTHAAQPTTTAVTATDLMTRLYLFSDDSMGGRLLDSPGNVAGAEYIGRELARLGLLPAGDSGTFFQTVPLVNRVFDPASALVAGGRRLTPWVDFIPRDQGSGARSIDGVPVVYGGTWGVPATLLPADSAAGKLVVLALAPTGYSSGIPGTATRSWVTDRFPAAAGFAVAGMDVLPAELLAVYQQPVQVMEEGPDPAAPSFLYVTGRVAALLLGTSLEHAAVGGAGHPVSGSPRFQSQPIAYPARNVVGLLRGRDASLRGEYVVLGAHNDHIGTESEAVAHDSIYVLNHLFRESGADDPAPRLAPAQTAEINQILAGIRSRTRGASARRDSIDNGADDDGSGSMGLLELAEYFAGTAPRPRRSLLFIWHVGEEEGLYGSTYFTDHPTVPRDSIVAQLNIDMIGRGGAKDVTGQTQAGGVIHGDSDYVQLIGSRRLSTQLGDLAEQVNQGQRRPLHFDYALDANGHPQNIYCRSDHWSYARFGIPIIFFTTGGHADYHQVTDEPQYIDYDRLARVTEYIGTLATRVADLDARIVVDHPRPDPLGSCRQ